MSIYGKGNRMVHVEGKRHGRKSDMGRTRFFRGRERVGEANSGRIRASDVQV